MEASVAAIVVKAQQLPHIPWFFTAGTIDCFRGFMSEDQSISSGILALGHWLRVSLRILDEFECGPGTGGNSRDTSWGSQSAMWFSPSLYPVLFWLCTRIRLYISLNTLSRILNCSTVVSISTFSALLALFLLRPLSCWNERRKSA
jgi:hypothetical protein